MITALLLPLLVVGTPGGAVRAGGGGDPAIQIWINNDRRFLPGDRAKVQVRTRDDGYLLVFHVDPDGHLRVLFPIDPGDDNFVRGGRKYEIRGRGGRESFTADDRRGRGTVYAAVSHDPYRFDQFVLGDHWDYRNLAPQRLSSDPEQDLNELVRRMVDASFDYDILTYDVLERVVYASGYDGNYYNYYDGYYGGCGYWYYCRPYYGSPYSVSIGLFFGRPYRRFYYDPFFAGYDPFYDPFFFDPYYYRPFYYRPYFYPGYAYPYGGYYYNHRYFYGGNRFYYGNRYWNRPYTPYRFRPLDGTFATYRDRRYTFGRSVNTVYLPPTVRDRTPVNASPGRRVTETRPTAETSPAVETRTRTPSADGSARRETGPARAPKSSGGRRAENHLSQPSIDARRARQPEETRSIIPDARDQADRRNLPTEIRPSRSDDSPGRATDRPGEARGREARPVTEIEARPSRREDGNAAGGRSYGGGDARATRGDPQPDPRRAEPPSNQGSGVYRSEPRSSDWNDGGRGSDRGSYAPSSRQAPSDGGGSRGGDAGRGGSGGGGDRGGSGGSGGGGGGYRRR